MAGTLTVYHCPSRPNKVRNENYTINTALKEKKSIENIHSKYKSPNNKQQSQK
jgi:hypothetical protein